MITRFGVWPALLFVGLFFVLPLLALWPEAWDNGHPAFTRLLADPLFWPGLRNTLALGLCAGLLSTLMGGLIAWHLARVSPAWQSRLMALLGLPLAFSGMIIAYGFILAFGRSGFVTQLMAQLGIDPARAGTWIYSVIGLVLAYAYYLIPRVALTLFPVLAHLDTRQIEAARTLGSTPAQAFWHVVLPEIRPALQANLCLITALSMGTYGTALALVGTQVNILPLLLYSKIGDSNQDFPLTAALSIVLLGLCSIILGLGEYGYRQRNT